MILEYKLHMTAGGMRTPEWVEDGGILLTVQIKPTLDGHQMKLIENTISQIQ